MENLIKKSAYELRDLLNSKEVSAVEVVESQIERIEKTEAHVEAFLHLAFEDAKNQAVEIDKKRAKAQDLPSLAGIPIAVKDMLTTENMPTTSASKILKDWQPPYDATVVKLVKESGMIILGKTNLDEFAMGSSGEHSAYKITKNPWDSSRTPGGSGSGSAAAVASYQVPLALGSDTGGSIRFPAAVTGGVGVKPTYGAVSRFGAIALASSLDQVGPAARNIKDAALLHDVIAGHDPKDSTSLNYNWQSFEEAVKNQDLANMKFGVIKQLNLNDDSCAGKHFQKCIKLLSDAGAEIIEVDCPAFDYALAAYYLILPAEASSNLAKYDGIRYGVREDATTVTEMMKKTRGTWFGPEVKRRLIIGTYALSAGFGDAYYQKAQQVRTLIQQDFNNAFSKVDVLLSPTTPNEAFKLGEKLTDPIQMYMNDLATIPSNLAGTPSLSIPMGLSENNLPLGLQIQAAQYQDHKLYQVAGPLEYLLHQEFGGEILLKSENLTSGVLA